jgi:hypothetical protein
MNVFIFLGKFFAPIATIATAAAALVGVVSYVRNRKKEVHEQKKLVVDGIRNSLKTLRDESQFLASYLGKDDLNSPIFLATSEIRAEMSRRLAEANKNMTLADFSEHLKKSNVMYFCILAGWQNSIFTQKIGHSIEQIKKVEFSLTGKFTVIGALGKFMAIIIQKKFSPSMYFPFWQEALENTQETFTDQEDQEPEKITVQKILNVFENELLKATFQHFRKNNYHEMVASFNSLINVLTLVILEIQDEETLYKLAKASSPSINLNQVKDLSSSLDLAYSEEDSSKTFVLIGELSKRRTEMEEALDNLEIEIENKVKPKLFGKYKALRKQVAKEIESYIIKDDKKEKEANTNFKKSFEVNVKASAPHE